MSPPPRTPAQRNYNQTLYASLANPLVDHRYAHHQHNPEQTSATRATDHRVPISRAGAVRGATDEPPSCGARSRVAAPALGLWVLLLRAAARLGASTSAGATGRGPTGHDTRGEGGCPRDDRGRWTAAPLSPGPQWPSPHVHTDGLVLRLQQPREPRRTHSQRREAGTDEEKGSAGHGPVPPSPLQGPRLPVGTAPTGVWQPRRGWHPLARRMEASHSQPPACSQHPLACEPSGPPPPTPCNPASTPPTPPPPAAWPPAPQVRRVSTASPGLSLECGPQYHFKGSSGRTQSVTGNVTLYSAKLITIHKHWQNSLFSSR